MQGRSWGEGEWCRPEGLSIRADKINIIQEKSDFLRSINFTLLSQINVNSINNGDFEELIVSVRGSHCYYS